MSRVIGNTNGRDVEFTTTVSVTDKEARTLCAALLVLASKSTVADASVDKYVAELAVKLA
mgnify:CR=1 FL=1